MLAPRKRLLGILLTLLLLLLLVPTQAAGHPVALRLEPPPGIPGPIGSATSPGTASQPGPGRPLKIVRTADGREVVDGRIVVGFRDSVGAAEKAQVHSTVASRGLAMTAVRAAGTTSSRSETVDVPQGVALDRAIQAYRSDARVRYAEPDYVFHTLETPNDPSFGTQWGMAKIQASSAWTITHGSSAVKIAIIDTGIMASHPDLAGKVVASSNFTSENDGDYYGHGTHVAGTVAANTGNGIGVAGIGYATSLMDGKVMDNSATGTASALQQAIYWAADNGAKVINMSLGDCGSTPPYIQDAVDYAWAKGAILIAAAGNYDYPRCAFPTDFWPASANHVISVAATASDDSRASFSNYGSWVTLAAPGQSIYSTYNNGGYASMNGTSMATPHVAGLAGLVWATGWASSPQAVVSRITSTADQIAGTGTLWQYGRINAAKAVTGSLDGSARLQRPTSASQAARTANVTLWVFPANSATANRSGALYSSAGILDSSDHVSFDLSGIPPGSYDVVLKGSHTLGRIKPNVALVAGQNQIDFGALLEGDVNGDNRVDASDLDVLSSSFGSRSGAPEYDSRADFSQDSAVTIADFSLLGGNYGLTGDQSAP